MGDAANNAELNMLLDNGVDLLSITATILSKFPPAICLSMWRNLTAGRCFKNAVNKDMVVINMMELMGDSQEGNG